MLILGRYGVAVLGWVTTLIIVRTLTQAQFGQYSVVFSVLGIIGIVSELRLSRVVLQRVMHGDDDPNEVVSSYTTLRLLIGGIAYLLAMAVAHQDPHALKFSETCAREHALNPDPVYLLAARHILSQLKAW